MNLLQIGGLGDGLKIGELDPEVAAAWRLPIRVPIRQEDAGAEATPELLAAGMRRLLERRGAGEDSEAFERFLKKQERGLFDAWDGAVAARDWRRLKGVLEVYTAIDPEDARAWSDLGTAYRRCGMRDLALDAYRTAMDHDRAIAPAQTGYASLLLEGGQAAKALEFAEHSLRVREAQPSAHLVAGQALGELGRHEEALAHLARAVELAPDDPRLPYPVAAALANTGDLLGALAAIGRGLEIAPGHPELLSLQRQVEQAMLASPEDA